MDRWLERASEKANEAEGRAKVGCVALSGPNLAACVTNLQKTHPRQLSYAKKAGLPKKASLHAEISALLKSDDLVDTLIVARVDKKGNLKLARPCPVCELAIETYPNDIEVWYSTEDGFEKDERFSQ